MNAKKIQCHMCNYCLYIDKKQGYYCTHPHQPEPRLIVACKRYQMGIRSPRWCRKKQENESC